MRSLKKRGPHVLDDLMTSYFPYTPPGVNNSDGKTVQPEKYTEGTYSACPPIDRTNPIGQKRVPCAVASVQLRGYSAHARSRAARFRVA